MSKLRFAYGCGAIAALLACFDLSAAQQKPAAMEMGRADNPTFQSVELDSGHKQNMDFVIRISGSVSGRIFDERCLSGLSQSLNSTGVTGVKITLRSRDAGFENFRLEQFTDANGMYLFQELRPGKYMIEIDPKYLPAEQRSRETTDHIDSLSIKPQTRHCFSEY